MDATRHRGLLLTAAGIALLLAATLAAYRPVAPRGVNTGSEFSAQRATAIWKQLLAEYQPPPLDPAIAEALSAYVARRKEEGGVPVG